MVKTLLFSGGGVHDSANVGPALQAILAGVAQLDVTYVYDDLSAFEAGSMAAYDLCVCFNTGGVLTDGQKLGLLNWLAAGKGFVGIHSAADSFQECPEYRAMVGGYFIGHPHYRDYMVSVADSDHPITSGLTEFMVRDEQYITSYDSRNQVLATALYQGIARPVVWVKPWGKGRVCWIALGHDPAACQNEAFATILTRACTWAAAEVT
jgi:uncharacterized protein